MLSAPRIIRNLTLASVVFLGAHHSVLADPPARVGRLSYMQGTVSQHSADATEWSAAQVNFPVTTGNAFWTEPQARAELQVGDMKIRLDQSTELDVTQLDDAATVLNVPQGIINIKVGDVPPGGVKIDTAISEVTITKPGIYHIDAGQIDANNPDTPPSIMQLGVIAGQAQVAAENTNSIVTAGKIGVLSGNPLTFALENIQPTEFDRWAASRDKVQVAPRTTRYISPQVTGYDDLEDQGGWETAPEYGAVWYPTTVAADWAPYRYGHWGYVAPWGWTWIDDAPWGFAPFHYGRWVRYHERWGWCPGQRVVRPVYAPALVTFVGGGPGAGFDISIGGGRRGPGIGWVPLAPREVYRPYYNVSNDYFHRVNVTNVNRTVINRTNITNVRNVTINNYANAGSTTVVSRDSFARGVPVHRAQANVDRNRLGRASSGAGVTELKQIAPTREARLGGGERVIESQNRPAPAPVPHRSFNDSRVRVNFRNGRAANAPQENRTVEPQLGKVNAPASPEVRAPQVPAPNQQNRNDGKNERSNRNEHNWHNENGERNNRNDHDDRNGRNDRDDHNDRNGRNDRDDHNDHNTGAAGPAITPRVIRGTENNPAPSIPSVTRPVRTPQVRTPQVRTPEARVPEVRSPEIRTPEIRSPEVRTPTAPKVEPVRTPEAVRPEPVVHHEDSKPDTRRRLERAGQERSEPVRQEQPSQDRAAPQAVPTREAPHPGGHANTQPSSAAQEREKRDR